MKKWSKRVLCMLLATVMVVSLAACGGTSASSDNTAKNEDAKKYVYRMEDIASDIIDEDSNVYSVNYVDGRIYMLLTQNRWDEMVGMTARLVSAKDDGSDVRETELFNTLRENPDYYNEDMDGDGNVGIMPLDAREEAVTEEEPTDDGASQMYSNTYVSSAVINENGVYLVIESSSYYYDEMGNYNEGEYSLDLYAYSLTGEEQFKVTLNDSQEEYMWVNTIASDTDGNIALLCEGKVLLYDKAGTPVSEIDTSSQGGYVQAAFMKDGKLNMVGYNDDWTKMLVKVYNLQTKSFESDVELPGNLTNYGMRTGKNYDLLLTSSNGLFGYNIGDAEPTQILSYINSDLDSNNINQIYEMGDNKLLCTYYDEETWTSHLAVLTYVDPADIPDKEVLTLACYYLDYYMRKRIVAFNKENEQYRITVKDYSTYSTMDDYAAGYTQLNNDILSGQVPDILVINDYNMPVSSYIAKGVLADIGQMIDDDPELNREDFMTNVFDAYSVDGKLYSVIPSFYVSTVIGKTADVGDTPGWTMDDLKALMEKHPESSVFGETMTRDTMLWQVMMFSGSRYVDRTTGECHFDTQEFIDMLEFLAQFPEEYDWENADDSYWRDYETQYRSGKTLLMQTSISDFGDYGYYTQGYFGEPVTLIGFPSEEGIGAVVSANNQYAISAKSKNKEGAWEFLRYYLTEEYQTSNEMSYTLPIRKDALLAKLEEAKDRPYWLNEDGSKEYYDRTYWIGDQEIIINPLTDEETDMLYDYISSITMANYYDDSLRNIITEEAAAFFEGQKSAAEVAEIIQSRAQIYINESR